MISEQDKQKREEIEIDTSCMFWPIKCPVSEAKKRRKEKMTEARMLLAKIQPITQSGLTQDMDSFITRFMPLIESITSMSAAEYCVACALFEYPATVMEAKEHEV